MFSKIFQPCPPPSKIPEILKLSNPKIPWIFSITLKLEYTPPWICGLVLYDPIILYCGPCFIGWFQGTRQTQCRIHTFRWGGGGSSNPEIREGLKKNFFRASVWSKNKGEARAPQAPPLDPPLKLTVFELYFIVRNV